MAETSAPDNIDPTDTVQTKGQTLAHVYALATVFSGCVESFTLINPSKFNDSAQRVALAKLGVQQARLLGFGDAVGISAPPPTIATHMIPARPGITNPDPYLPINFGDRDARLDEAATQTWMVQGLQSITNRLKHMSKEETVNIYGMKKVKSSPKDEHPTLDANRLEGFLEKYALLGDLVMFSGISINMKHIASAPIHRWIVKDAERFIQYVDSIREGIDELIDYMGVGEQVSRSLRSDIRCMAWHPDITASVAQLDYQKLKLIRDACHTDYPEYVSAANTALRYIDDELRENDMIDERANSTHVGLHLDASSAKCNQDCSVSPTTPQSIETPDGLSWNTCIETMIDTKDRKDTPSDWISAFRLKSLSKISRPKNLRATSHPSSGVLLISNSFSCHNNATERHQLPIVDIRPEPVRSKSSGALPHTSASGINTHMHSSIRTSHFSPTNPVILSKEGQIIKDFAHLNSDRWSGINANTLTRMQKLDYGDEHNDWAGS